MHKPTQKNTKEPPSQRTGDSANLTRQTFDQQKTQQVTAVWRYGG